MAASLTAQSRDLTNCTKCHQLLQSPRSLPCLHSYCTTCLEEHVNDAKKVKCIECGEEFDLPPGGLKEWQPLAIVCRLTEQKTLQIKLMSDETIHCTNCVWAGKEGVQGDDSDLPSAEARCTDCDDYLCKRCIVIHKSLRRMKDHQILTLDELRTGKVFDTDPVERQHCTKHKGEVLLFYCETCDVPICRQCGFITHRHPEHKQVELEQAAKNRSEQLQQLRENCGKNKEVVKQALHDIRKIRREFDVAVSEARCQIKDTVQKIRSAYLKRLDEAQEATEEELGTIEKKGLETIKTADNQLTSIMSRMETAEAITDVLKKSGGEFEVAADYGSLKAVLQDVVAVDPSTIINSGQNLTDVKFEENTNQNVEKIVIGRVWHTPCHTDGIPRKREAKNGGAVLNMEFGNVGNQSLSCALDVAETPTGQIAVTDCNKASVKIFSPNGTFKSAFNVNVGIDAGKSSQPWCIQVGPDNVFYITDNESPFVKIFDLQGTYKRYFHTVSPDNIAYNTHGSSAVCGLAINSKQQLLAGNITHNFISCHSLDGTHLKSIKVAIKPWFLAVTSKGNIVVTPYSAKEAFIIDEGGTVLTKLQTPTGFSSWQPSGIAVSKCYNVDDDGDEMFVVDYANGYNVYRYSFSGKYIDCVAKNLSTYAFSVALSADEKLLYVANNKSVKCFEI